MRSVHGWKGVETILKNVAKKNFVCCLINNTTMVSMELKIHMIVTSKLRKLSKFLVISGTCNRLRNNKGLSMREERKIADPVLAINKPEPLPILTISVPL